MELYVPNIEQTYATYDEAGLELKFICKLVVDVNQNVFSMRINNKYSLYKIKSNTELLNCTKYNIKKCKKFPSMLIILTETQELFVFGNNRDYQIGLKEAIFIDSVTLLKDNVQDFVCYYKKNNTYLLVVSDNKLYVSGSNLYGNLGIGEIANTPLREVDLPKHENLEIINYDSLHVAIMLDNVKYISGVKNNINSNIFIH